MESFKDKVISYTFVGGTMLKGLVAIEKASLTDRGNGLNYHPDFAIT